MIAENKRVIFIDLDGTLIRPVSGGDFAKNIIDLMPIWRTWTALKNWSEKATGPLWLFIVSNQGGIETRKGSKEKYIIAKLEYISSALSEFLKEKVIIDYNYCPSNNPENLCRKPNTGMLSNELRLFKLDNIKKEDMLMIGDASGKDINPKAFSDSDYKTAINFGIDYLDVDQL